VEDCEDTETTATWRKVTRGAVTERTNERIYK